MNTVEVVPSAGLIDTAQLGVSCAATSTAFDAHDVVPPGPEAVSVALWLPSANVVPIESEHGTLP